MFIVVQEQWPCFLFFNRPTQTVVSLSNSPVYILSVACWWKKLIFLSTWKQNASVDLKLVDSVKSKSAWTSWRCDAFSSFKCTGKYTITDVHQHFKNAKVHSLCLTVCHVFFLLFLFSFLFFFFTFSYRSFQFHKHNIYWSIIKHMYW